MIQLNNQWDFWSINHSFNLEKAASNDTQNAGPVEEFGKEISQVGRGEDGEGFHHSHVIGEFGDKWTDKAAAKTN